MQYLRTPLTVPRYVLTVKYALFIALGAAVGTASAPSSFEAITPDWYTPIWGALLALSALLALIGSLRESREALERWSVSAVASLLIGYAFAPIVLVLAGDSDRLAYSVVALTVAMVPVARAIQLLKRTGIKKNG
jgi:FtsH-binding integral membrane protein